MQLSQKHSHEPSQKHQWSRIEMRSCRFSHCKVLNGSGCGTCVQFVTDYMISPCASWAPPLFGGMCGSSRWPFPHRTTMTKTKCWSIFPYGCGWHSALGRHLAALCPQPAPRPSGSDTSWLRPGASRLCQFQPRPQQKCAGPRAPAQSFTSARALAPITSAAPAQQRELHCLVVRTRSLRQAVLDAWR